MRLSVRRELAARRTGWRFVAGVDEVGRGALAGPVVAAAVMLPLDDPAIEERLEGVRDSKQMSPPDRLGADARIRAVAVSVGIGWVEPVVIDILGIRPATEWAMLLAVAGMAPCPDLVLVDGLPLRGQRIRHQAVVGGDRLVLSIAAAAVVAKVARDSAMIALSLSLPEYGFDRHKGYGVPEHLAAILALGPTPHHRLTWAPLRAAGRSDRAAWTPALPGMTGMVGAGRPGGPEPRRRSCPVRPSLLGWDHQP